MNDDIPFIVENNIIDNMYNASPITFQHSEEMISANIAILSTEFPSPDNCPAMIRLDLARNISIYDGQDVEIFNNFLIEVVTVYNPKLNIGRDVIL